MKRARLEVRVLTHTLHLPPALSEIYGGPRPEWLKDLLDYLPCLQSLMVSSLPFFDHNATVPLKLPSNPEQAREYPSYNLRLLLAEKEPNTTSIGLAHALSRFPALIYVDLSYTSSARDHVVLSILGDLAELQVLKLRGIGLKDADAEFLANAIGTRVRLLDLRDNFLTDMAVRSLMQACFMPEDAFRAQLHSVAHQTDGAPLRGYTATILRRPNLDETLLEVLTRPLTGRSLLENLPHVGITHLYISDNQLTVEGVAGLLASKRLNLLDVGTVDTAKSLRQSQPVLSQGDHREEVNVLPGAEKLVPILGISAKDNLTYLRMNHKVVTKDAPSRDQSVSELLPEFPADEGPSVHNLFSELDPANEIHELPAGDEPLYEMADTSVAPSERTVTSHVSRIQPYPDEPLHPRRGSAFAQEISDAGLSGNSQMKRSDTAEISADLSRLKVVTRAEKIQELLAKRPKNNFLPLRQGDSTFPYLHPSHIPHVETLVLTDVPSHVPADSPIISSLIRFITACSEETLLATLQAKANYSLPPGRNRIKAEQQHAKSLFALERLVIEITPAVRKTEHRGLGPWMPQQYGHATYRSTTGDHDSEQLWSAALNDFSFFGNEECGIPDLPEDEMAKGFPMALLNEKVHLMSDDESTHSGPSELEVPMSPNLKQSSPRLAAAHQRQSAPNSTQVAPTSVSSGAVQPSPPPKSPNPLIDNVEAPTVSTTPEVPEVDVVATVAAFRRNKRNGFEELTRANRNRKLAGGPSPSSPSSSSSPPPMTPTSPQDQYRAKLGAQTDALPLHVEGHWKGEVKVVRNASPKGRTGVVDIFGNYFEKGYLYP